MKVSESFKTIIWQQLQLIAQTNGQLAEAISKEDKKLDDCIKYIIMNVQKSGINGFADEEVFDMAIDYYLTEKVDLKGDIKCKVVVNRMVQLTDEEKKKAKEDALNALIKSETQRLSKPKPTAVAKPKTDGKSNVSLSLFD
ncbi:PcfK-like family protein [Parapedobacter sp. 10938]|uniref:PcfK-like family protein n=1 Tax=Parapedobacter flavus TaxID=3110225 RepID=UPI002DBF5B6A|nr:Cas9 inhibitor AcrIIA9 family protein [Parapedobacter sp. 10938]MEC3881991.1 Cas9 inhibitor AcrIIA9 family protein [Parapedobacter sp. 10938]